MNMSLVGMKVRKKYKEINIEQPTLLCIGNYEILGWNQGYVENETVYLTKVER